MSYKIVYDPQMKGKYPLSTGKIRYKRWLYTLLLASVIVTALTIPEISTHLKYWLLPGDPQATEAALINLAAELKNDTAFKEAFTGFCLEILENAH